MNQQEIATVGVEPPWRWLREIAALAGFNAVLRSGRVLCLLAQACGPLAPWSWPDAPDDPSPPDGPDGPNPADGPDAR